MSQPLSQQVVIVTGAGRGLGSAASKPVQSFGRRAFHQGPTGVPFHRGALMLGTCNVPPKFPVQCNELDVSVPWLKAGSHGRSPGGMHCTFQKGTLT